MEISEGMITMQKQVLLVGTGLIGGSIALAIKKEHDVYIVGYDINEEQVKRAKEIGVIDEIGNHLLEEAEKADIIILASPVEVTVTLLEQLATCSLREHVILTDVGSTKVEIMRAASQLANRGITFIGGHPMAGSHKTGVESARAHLFENAFYILTPFPNTPEESIDQMKELLKGTRAHFLILDQNEHDYVTGIVSHFPHVVASGLVKLIKKHADENDFVTALASGGFRDITRIASSSPKMWTDIVMQNRTQLIHLIQEWITEMKQVEEMIECENKEGIYDFFFRSKQYRDSLPVNTTGAIPSYFDLYVDVIDKVGALADITSILAKHDISVSNLQILEVREGLLGVLRISLQSEKDRSSAKSNLESEQYQTYEVL